MRKNTARHWLHAALDLLPVLLIPVFMIYSHRHDVSQDFVKHEPVYYQTNEVNTYTDLSVGNIYKWVDNVTYNVTETKYLFSIDKYSIVELLPSSIFEDISLVRFTLVGNSSIFYLNYYYTNNSGWVNIANTPFDFVISGYDTSYSETENIINGFTPSNTLIVKEYIDVTIPKDVMTSFMDRFNNTIDNYFNMGNVFNLNGVYQWFNTNIFGGTAPAIIYSVWNIALYEFVMDLIFLLYALFMWFIDVTKRLIEKPLDTIK